VTGAGGAAAEGAAGSGDDLVRRSRRRAALDASGMAAAAVAFGLVYGLAARGAGFSAVEAVAMSVLVFAGAAQFAAVGFVAQGVPWVAIVGLTFLLNARHLLYSAVLAPWLQAVPRRERAVMAHALTDESFAVGLSHFRRLGRADVPGYWIGALFILIPWPIATLAGYLGGQLVPDPTVLGLDIVFPAAMGALAVGVATGRREAVAAVAGAIIGVGVALALSVSAGIVAGGLLGPLVGLAVPHRPSDAPDDATALDGHDEAIGVAP
jgi:4-azaleucine resistance transporter AzlC